METLGGYRLVRILGSGKRADVWLGHGGERVRSTGHEPVMAAVKVFRAGVPIESIDREIEALGRVDSRHLAHLDDLATTPDGRPCVILKYLASCSLGRLLATRSALGVGEAVTILAPIALAIAELHRVGVSHGAIRPSSVLFDGSGAPVLVGFGSSSLASDFPAHDHEQGLSTAQRAQQPSMMSDFTQLAALSRIIFERVDGTGAIAQWLDDAEGSRWSGSFATDLADRIFDLGPPSAVWFDVVGTRENHGELPQRLGRMATHEAAAVTQASVETAPVGAWTAMLHVPEAWEIALAKWTDRTVIRTLLRTLRTILAPVRKSVWIVAGVTVMCLAAALLITPLITSHGELSAKGATVATVGGDSEIGALSPSEHSSSDHSSAVSPSLSAKRNSGADASVAGKDPVIAAKALLSAREACIRRLSVLCLDSVDQQESAVMDADRHLVRTAQEGGVTSTRPELTNAEISLVERLGDTVLMNVTFPGRSVESEPISLLLVRESAGWRIRDLTMDGVAG